MDFYLGKIGVSGPRHFSYPNLDAHSRLVGRGAQFEVFELTSGTEPNIVVKRVRLDRLPDSTSLDTRSHLRTLQLEIASLCDPARRSNRNIVKLVTWGYDYPSPNLNLRVPILCVEKAICALGDFLQGNNFEVDNAAVPYQLCLDISAGLQGIHSTALVHGDLKPANVLVFKQDHDDAPFIAKLSDFGQCIEVNEQVKSFASYSGTQGWQPPECASEQPGPIQDFHPDLLFKCDSYAYGLLALSVLMFNGEVVPFQELIGTGAFLSRSQASFIRLPECSKMCVEKITSCFLRQRPEDRADVSSDLVKCEEKGFVNWRAARLSSPQDSRSTSHHETSTNYQYYSSLDLALLAQLEAQLSNKTRTFEDFGGELVFGMAIRSLGQSNVGHRERSATYFEAAAKQCNLSARAIFRRVQAAAKSSGISIGVDVNVIEWLFEGASTGSFIAMEDLNRENPDLARMARKRFLELGGFNTDMSLVIRDRVSRPDQDEEFAGDLNQAIDDHGNRPLHYAASFGPVSLVKNFVGSGAFIDAQNDLGETALYKACQAANVSSVKVLVSLGANASIVSSTFGISCLHWLFNFDQSDISDVAQLLVSRGAKVDALTDCDKIGRWKRRISASHFPFHWPHGAPIHWAAFTGSHTAIDTLLDLGASVDSPSAVEPAEARTALAIAVRRGDSMIVRHLLTRGADPNLQDGIKRTALYAMATRYANNDEFNDWPNALRWWIYHGSWQDHVEELTRCVRALADAGCDLNAWTPLPGSNEYFINPVTSAAEDGLAGPVLALLRGGAAIDCVRPYQRDTTLHIWTTRNSHGMSYAGAFSTVWKTLFETSRMLNIRDVYGHSLWHQAIKCGSVDDFRYIAGFLTSAKPPVSLETADNDEETPLLDAAGFKAHAGARPSVVIWSELLLDLGADITARDYDNRDFIFLLCMNGALSDSECLQLIQRAFRDIPVETQQDLICRSVSLAAGQTPLMWACHNFFAEVVKFFLTLGVDVNVISKTNGTALDFALDSSEGTRRSYISNWVFEGKLLFDDDKLYFTDLDASVNTLTSPTAFLNSAQAVTRLFQRTVTEADVRNKLTEDGYADAHKYFACMEVVRVMQSEGARSATDLLPNLTGYTPLNPRDFDKEFVEDLELGSDTDKILAEMQPFYEEHWKLLYSLRPYVNPADG